MFVRVFGLDCWVPCLSEGLFWKTLEVLIALMLSLMLAGYLWADQRVNNKLCSIRCFISSLKKKGLIHWGQVTHICVSELTIIGSDDGLSPGRRLAIIWNSAGLLLIEPLGTNFSEISIEIQTFSFRKMHLNMSSAKWRPFCLGLNVLMVSKNYGHVFAPGIFQTRHNKVKICVIIG